jgi:putative transposase
VIVPDTVVIDHGRVFVSENFLRSCERLGISVQKAKPRTPTDKSVVERTFHSINTLFVQHLPGYTGANVQQRGSDVGDRAVWTIPDLQDLLDEWVVAGWQTRPHQALRDPHAPKRCVAPNERYAALVAAAGYLPLTLTGRDYLELLPIEWRAIGDGGIQIDYRTYDHPDLGPLRRQNSGIEAKDGRWEVHYDPYDVTRVFVRAADHWITVPWTHLPMLSAPFADFTWRHARKLAAAAGADHTNETVVARVLTDLLGRASHGPAADKPTARILARTRAALRSPLGTDEPDAAPTIRGTDSPDTANVVPFAVFDAHKESERWS